MCEQSSQAAGDDDSLMLKLISEGHGTFCAVMSDRLHCLASIKQVLSDGDFKVILTQSVCLSVCLKF